MHKTACQRVWPGTHADVRDGVPLWPPDDERRRDQQETVKETCRWGDGHRAQETSSIVTAATVGQTQEDHYETEAGQELN